MPGLILLGIVLVTLLVPLSYWLDIPRREASGSYDEWPDDTETL